VGVPSNVTLQHFSIIRPFLTVIPYHAEFCLATYLTGFTQHISSCLRHISHRVYITQLIVTVWRIVIVFAPRFTMCQLHTCASTPHTMYLTIFSIRASSCLHYVCHRVSNTYLIVFRVHILPFTLCIPPYSNYISHHVHLHLTAFPLHI